MLGVGCEGWLGAGGVLSSAKIQTVNDKIQTIYDCGRGRKVTGHCAASFSICASILETQIRNEAAQCVVCRASESESAIHATDCWFKQSLFTVM